ncbi:MAG: LysM peptidoglycan-binding domain-containing protein [Bacteroidia bacterium]|nr:LysM peptidoglycan-binding domain-containing protein [Bacteroidia bacterium]MDW8235080.1 LysM peptidoglycan-binding domain-containing protein [Bacteroidia bacterium]
MEAPATTISVAESIRPFSIWVGVVAEGDRIHREVLGIMLKNAGYSVEVPEQVELNALAEIGKKHDAAFLILGVDKGPVLPDGSLLLQRQYEILLQQVSPSFRLIVWAPRDESVVYELEARELLTFVENTLTERVMLTRTPAMPLMIGEVKSFLAGAVEARQIIKQYDIAFIHNVRDSESCFSVIENLSKKYKLQSLAFRPEKADEDVAESLRLYQQSQLLVVFFHYAGDWALALTQQLWKAAGGLSQATPIYLVGFPDPLRNRYLSLQVPNVRLELVEPPALQACIEKSLAEARRSAIWSETKRSCPYIGLRPFEEGEAIFFHGREKHIRKILELLEERKFVMVSGASGDGKSSLVFAGVLPALRANLMPAAYPSWAIAAFRPEKQPLTNLATALASAIGHSNIPDVETKLSYGFSALVDLYKQSHIYIDPTSPAFEILSEADKIARLREGQNLLILVDQFEEFFTNEENYSGGIASPLAQITVNVLSETIRIARRENLPIWVIFTMRSDFIGQCVAFHGFAELIGESTYFVPRLTREEFQAVIEKPAELNGDRITPRLTQRLLNDIGDGIDQLPVLQHALHRIWHVASAQQEPMDLVHYAMVGGLHVSRLPEKERTLFEQYLQKRSPTEQELYQHAHLRNVLNFHAETLYEHLDEYYEKRYGERVPLEQLQQIARGIFVPLTRIDEGRAVRARLTLQQLTDILGLPGVSTDFVAKVAALFRDTQVSFLQPALAEGQDHTLSPNDTLTVSHEALIRNWERLIRWAEQEAQSVRIFRELKFQVQRWLEQDRSPRLLLSGGSYQYFSEWYYPTRPNPAWIRRNLPPDELVPNVEPITQAIALRDAIELYLARSKARIERNRRLLLLALFVITLLFLLSLVALYYAQIQRALAEKNAEEARLQARIAQEQRMKAEANAQEALRQRMIAEKERLLALHQKMLAENALRIAEAERNNAERQRRIAEDQRQIAERERERALQQQRIAENQTRVAESARINAEYERNQAEYQTALALQQRNKALVLQSLFLASLSEDQTRKGHPEIGVRLALEALPRQIGAPGERPYVPEAEAALYFALHAHLYPKPPRKLIGHKNRVIYAVFSPDGSKLATASWDKTIRIWNPTTGASQEVLRGHTHIVEKVYFTQDLKYLASLSEDFSVRLWDLRSGVSVAQLVGHQDNLTHIALSADGSIILTTSLDRTCKLWNGLAGELIHSLSLDEEVLWGVLTQDGRKAAVATRGGLLYLWSWKEGASPKRLSAHVGAITQLLLSPDERYILALSEDGTSSLWNWEGKLITRLKGHNAPVKAAAFHPSGNRLITAGADSMLYLWKLPEGIRTHTLPGHKGIPYAIQWSPTGEHILSIATDQKAILWSGSSFLRLTEYSFPLHIQFRPAFHPEGTYLAVPGEKGTVLLYPLLPKAQQLINLAQEKNIPDLNSAQRRKFFLEDPRISEEVIAKRKVPRARLHIVRPGETLSDIAAQYKVSTDQLRQLNRLENDNIRAGDSIIITYYEE